MTTAENIAIIAEWHHSQFRPMLERAQRESVSETDDECEGCAMTDYTFADGSTVRVCTGHMEAI